MKTEDIKSGVFVIVCMAAAGLFGYYAGKHRVEVQTVYVGRFKMSPDTNGTYRLGIDTNIYPQRFTNDDPGYVLTSSNTWVPIPFVYPAPASAPQVR